MSNKNTAYKIDTAQPIKFIDLEVQQKRIRPQIEEALKRVLDHNQYILGPEVFAFEQALSNFSGAKHSISCANGTIALSLVLMAKSIGPGDAVFVPTFTFAATAEVVASVGATPIFVDSHPDTFNMDIESLKRQLQEVKKTDLKPKAIIPVDLFGLPADFDSIEAIASENNLWVLDDAAQALGATYKEKNIGTLGLATTTSFFPAKPLGGYGEGGAVFTDDDYLASRIKSLRVHGEGVQKYEYAHIGVNGRLDTFQAAILIEKLKIFPDELKARQKVAERYNEALSPYVKTPILPEGYTSSWAQYTIILPENNLRDQLITYLKLQGVPTAIYYPIPLHKQPIYQKVSMKTSETFSTISDLSQKVLSLPMHPYLDEEAQGYITSKIIQFFDKSSA